MLNLPRLVGPAVLYLFAATLVVAIYSTFILNIVVSGPIGHAMTIGLPTLWCLALFRWRHALVGWLSKSADRLDRVAGARVLLACLVVGVAVRLAVVWAYFPLDFGKPWETVSMPGRLMFQGVYLQPPGEYFASQTYAFWPPGRQLPYVPFLALTGNWYLSVWLYNTVLFVLTLSGVFLLARKVAGVRAANVAAVLVTLWPSLVFFYASEGKEAALIALLPWAMFAYLRGTDGSPRAAWMFVGCGVLVAALSFIQPSYLLLPVVFVVYEVLKGTRLRAMLGRAAIVWLAALLVISPWTYRNYKVLGEPVLISTNSGITFWVGNNPKANGGYDKPSEFTLDHLPEVERSATLRRMALAWIRENPEKAAKLMVWRVMLTVGSDMHSVYWAVQRGAGLTGFAYEAPVFVANLFWICAISTLLAPLASARIRRSLLDKPTALLLMLPLLYAVGLHSLVEGGDRHHVAAIAGLAVLLGVIYAADRDRPALAKT